MLLVDSSSTGSIALGSDTLNIKGMEGIDVTASGSLFTIAAETATDTNKGVASFDATDFGNTNGRNYSFGNNSWFNRTKSRCYSY